ncbi:hypothetical protein HVY60_03270 [Citrobacter freundii]|nr:hypothetical protein HVY60_03270 [Citrobacter freundii]
MSFFGCKEPAELQAPLIDSLLNEIGLSGGSLHALAEPLKNSPLPVEKTEA